MAISSPGVGSNLDVNGIVRQLMDIERQPIQALDRKEVSFQAQLSAFGTLKGGLSSFQSAVQKLATISQFSTRTVTSSDNAIASGTASSIAGTGKFNLNVTQLAQSHGLAAVGQVSQTAAIGAGTPTTIRIDFGTVSGGTLTNGVYTGATFTQDAAVPSGVVSINATNNSLIGIRDAINAANVGVSASIVGDGSAAPYRLVLNSSSTGENRSMRITVTGEAALSSLLSYDASATQNMTQTSAAQSAKFSLNGLELASTSNTVTSALDGVTVTLAKVGATTLTIGRDTASIKKSIEEFVKSYNEVQKTLKDLTGFDPQTRQAGPLNGDATARQVQARLRSALGESLGNNLKVSSLSQLGISFQKDGTLALDSAKLDAAIQANKPEDIAGAFARAGTATSSLVSVSETTAKTRAGTYAVSVSALATQGKVVGAAAAGLTITTGVNDTLNVNVDGTGTSVTLAAGTYTAATLAAAVQSAINGASAFSTASKSVTVTENAGVLTITSALYGNTSKVTVSGNGASNLLGGTPAATAGTNVNGTIGGLPATGSGQTLTGQVGSAVDGLKLKIDGSTPGERGTVTVLRGAAAKLETVLNNIIGDAGSIKSRETGINRSIEDLGDRREAIERRLVTVEQRYRAQFTSLDSLLGRMRSTSDYLAQQLNALNRGNG